MSPKGFTLIELMVVITIIAILSIVGVTVYSGVQNRANDARRKQDVEAIVQALEANKTTAGYQSLSPLQFASGSIPSDPNPPRVYCIATDNNVPANNALLGIANAGCNANSQLPSVALTNSGTVQKWILCATLSDAMFCKYSAQ